MNRGQKAALTAAGLIVLGIVAGVVITLGPRSGRAVAITGAVLRAATDERREMPIGGVQVTGVSGQATGECTSDSSGLFQLILHPGIKRGEPVLLKFQHAGYQPLAVTQPASSQLYIARMEPGGTGATSNTNVPAIGISNVRIRYTTKMTSTANVGSFAKTFEIVNTPNVPCRRTPPCSPDGKWKATTGFASFNAQEDNHFVNVRVSCIAGPCPFTRIQSDETLNGGRTIKVSALDWSATATFLVEAEVARTFESDMTLHSYPVIFGNGMNFTLPQGAEGLTIEAELNGLPIVFPLGPDLILSWATCSVKIDADQSRLYGCQLKPGYTFR